MSDVLRVEASLKLTNSKRVYVFQMVYMSDIDSIQEVSSMSTFFRFACGGCHRQVTVKGLRSCVNRKAPSKSGRGKPPPRSGGGSCQAIPNQCAVCHELVAGVYVWCQGCGHGGHLEHIEDWLRNSVNCPAGCGHSCEYF